MNTAALGQGHARLVAGVVLGLVVLVVPLLIDAPARADAPESSDGVVIPPGHPEPATPRKGGDETGRDVLAAAFAGPRRAVVGTVAVIVMDPDGPFVSELDVSATPTGQMVVGRSPSFAVGREGGDAFLARDGTLLRLGSVGGAEDAPGVDVLEVLLDNYDVHFAGRTSLDTGVADTVDLFDRGGHRRERLFVDRQTGVVVRRETFGPDGHPRRLVAFTDIDVIAPQFGSESMVGVAQDSGLVADLDLEALRTLGRAGWEVPEHLPGGYVLARGYALEDGAGQSSLHLVYTDGLYSTSLYQQRGELAAAAREGAVAIEHGDMFLWRWPGAQPERLLWASPDTTFTVVGDASLDQVLEAVSELPSRPPEAVGERLRRGVRRVASWLNPLG